VGAGRKTTIVEQGTARVLGQFSNSPKLQALSAGYLRLVQDFENAIWDVLEAIDIDTGPAFMVAILGRIVGRGQSSFTLDQFRALIRAQIRINKSSGVVEDFLEVAQLMVNGAPSGVSFEIARVGVKALQITQHGPVPAIGFLTLWDGFKSIVDSATKLYFVAQPSGEDEAFRFAPWPEPASNAQGPSDTSHGFGWDDGTGGKLAEDFST
jgi:hypothetical protein